MLKSLPPQSMYPSSAIHFRNPFTGPSHSHTQHKYNLNIPSPSSGHHKIPVSSYRPLTPPPDMNSVAPNVQRQPYSYYAADRSAAPVKYEPSQIKHEQANQSQHQIFSNAQPKSEVIPQSASRPLSPVFTQNPNTTTSRRESQLNSIAPSLQIPRTVNNSKGSLAELAAQVSSHDRPGTSLHF